jgi:thioredoxin-like negative regulator of GroEL
VALWNRKEFAEGTRDRSKPILLNFGARWCVHCQQLAPEYTRAALLLGEEVVVAAVDCTEDEALCQREQVQGYPSIRLLAPAPDLSVESFQPTGHHTEAEQLVAWVQQTLHSSVVTIRSAGEFRRKVLSSNESWVVDFSAGPWCPPCVAMKGVMRSLAARFAGPSSRAVNVAIVDCDAAKSLCQEQQVPFFPVVKLFPHDEAGKRALNGGRGISLAVDQQQMMAFPPGAALDIAAAILEAYAPPREAAPQAASATPGGARAADDSHGDEL